YSFPPRRSSDLGMGEQLALQRAPPLAADDVGAHDDDLVLVVSELDAADEAHLAMSEGGTDHQDDGDRKLHDDQRAAKRRAIAARGAVAPQRAGGLERGEVKARIGARDEARGEREQSERAGDFRVDVVERELVAEKALERRQHE